VGIGGFAWEAPGLIWYESLKASSAETQFQDFADTTYQKAEELFGGGSAEQLAVLAAWQEVGIQISGVPAAVARARSLAAGRDGGVGQADGAAPLTRQVGALAAQVTRLSNELAALKGRWPPSVEDRRAARPPPIGTARPAVPLGWEGCRR
jgi:hypothetical protein